MRGGHLDGRGERVDAGPPVDDAVALGVDRGERDVRRQRLAALVEALPRAVAGDAVLGHQARPAGPAEPDQHLDAPGQRRVVRTRRQHRAAEGDDAGDQVGAAYGEAAGEHAAEAVPDDLHPGAAPQRDRLQPALELGGGVEGAAGVDVDRGAVGAVALLAQHPRHRGERAVAREEAGDQDHRRRVPRPRPDRRTATARRGRRRSRAPRANRPGLGDGARLAQHRADPGRGEALRGQEVPGRQCDVAVTPHRGYPEVTA